MQHDDPAMTAIMPSPDTANTTVMRFQTLRDGLPHGSRHRPASAHDLPLWRPDVSPTAVPRPIPPPPPPKRTEQTDIRRVTSEVVGHVYRHRFNTCRDDLTAARSEWTDDNDTVVRDAAADMAAILAELDHVAEELGFRHASVRRLARSLALDGMDPSAVLAELHALR